MLYLDFDWDLRKDRIILDREINTDKLGWQAGDHFEVKNIDGQVQLVKVDPILKFIKGYE
jgi:hypothetical protein